MKKIGKTQIRVKKIKLYSDFNIFFLRSDKNHLSMYTEERIALSCNSRKKIIIENDNMYQTFRNVSMANLTVLGVKNSSYFIHFQKISLSYRSNF